MAYGVVVENLGFLYISGCKYELKDGNGGVGWLNLDLSMIY